MPSNPIVRRIIMPKGLLSDPADNIATMLSDVLAGEEVFVTGKADLSGFSVKASTDVPMYHKISLADIPEGGTISKYGNPMGIATRPIAKGEHVHIHNIASLRARRDS